MRWAWLVLVAACSSPAKPGRAERVSIGALDAWVLDDGPLTVPNDGETFGVGHPPDEVGDVLAAAGLPRDEIRLDLQCLLVTSADRVVLFDAGMGGHLQDSLARAGVAPGAVTDVFISHAHGDHVLGLVTKAGALAFPSATIHLSAPEWAAFVPESDDDRKFLATITPKVEPFEPGAQVLPFVTAVATPGHTPGHSSYAIRDGADTLFVLGDLAHHRVLSLQRPTWPIQYDADHAAAEAMRASTLARLAADHARVFAGHFPYPGLGTVVADGDAFAWSPR